MRFADCKALLNRIRDLNNANVLKSFHATSYDRSLKNGRARMAENNEILVIDVQLNDVLGFNAFRIHPFARTSIGFN